MNTIYIEFNFSAPEDDQYSVADWFSGGWNTIRNAQESGSKEAAEAILVAAYFGPDVDGVDVQWVFA